MNSRIVILGLAVLVLIGLTRKFKTELISDFGSIEIMKLKAYEDSLLKVGYYYDYYDKTLQESLNATTSEVVKKFLKEEIQKNHDDIAINRSSIEFVRKNISFWANKHN
jgi:hypothetical protein